MASSTGAQQGIQQGIEKLVTYFINFLIACGLLYTLFVVAMFLAQRNFMYFPDDDMLSPAESGVSEMAPVKLATSDDLELTAWYASAKDPSRPVVVIYHGNAGNISGRGTKARLFLDQGYGVLLAEYRGYGGNPGSPDEPGLLADGQAAINYLLGQGIQANQIVLYGESLGTGIAVELAMTSAFEGKPYKALVLEAPYSSLVDAARYHYPYLPVKMFLKDRFESHNFISAVRTPIFMFQGDQDRIIPIELGKKLYDAAQQPKQALWIEGAGHNNLYKFGAGAAVLKFLEQH